MTQWTDDDAPGGMEAGEPSEYDKQLELSFEQDRAERDRMMREAVEGALAAAMSVFEPPPRLTVSEWADEFRMLSPEASAEPGRWMTSRAEYMRDIMDAFNDPTVETMVMMASAQVGKTELLLNIAGYTMHQDPGPMLILQPTKEMAEAFSKDRLAPMMRDTPALAAIVGDAAARDSKQTIFHKSFPGGHVTMVGANSPAGLASRPIRIVLADEVDRYPASAGAEGDPLSLAVKRTTTFWNKKKIFVSTPTIKDHSRIEKAYESSDKRVRMCKCPDCGHMQRLVWAGVKWTDGDPSTAAYACEGCGVLWNDAARWSAMKMGEWVATAPFTGVAGWHLNQLISPWVTLESCVKEFLEAKRSGVQTLKTWTNTVLGETWEEQGERVDDNELLARRVDYGDEVPAEVVVVTAGVDIQQDRIEVERVGWAANDHSYGLGKIVLWGDPTGPEVWKALDELLQEPMPVVGGGEMQVKAAAVDSQYLTQTVANFCRDRWGRRVWAIRGVSGEGKPIWPKKAGKREKTRLPFFNVGVDSAKEVVYARLRVTDPAQAGYCWFNMAYDADHFDQMTSEEVRIKYTRGMPVREWHLKAGKLRNEALDIRAYALAALEGLKLMGLRIERVAARRGTPAPAAKPVAADSAPAPAVALPVAPDEKPPTPPRPAGNGGRRRRGRRIIGGMR